MKLISHYQSEKLGLVQSKLMSSLKWSSKSTIYRYRSPLSKSDRIPDTLIFFVKFERLTLPPSPDVKALIIKLSDSSSVLSVVISLILWSSSLSSSLSFAGTLNDSITDSW